MIEVDVVTFWKKDVVLTEKSMRYEMQKRRDPAQEEKKDSSESTKMKKRNKSRKEKKPNDEQKTNREMPVFIYELFVPIWVHERGNVKLDQG